MSFRSLASLRVAASFAVILIVSACSDDRVAQLSAVETIEVPAAGAGQQANQNIANPTLEIPVTYPVGEGDELTMVWSEEFDGPEIDPEVWFFATGDGTEKDIPSGWGNNELQWYLPDNAMIVNGVLEITARRETVGDFNYTSARINTEDRFAFKYGRIEASIKMPSGQGLLPAFWMLSQSEDLSKNSDYTCGGDECIWAAIGEIDIVEASNPGGTGGNEILGTIHYGGESPGNLFTTTYFTPSVDITETFNTYALEWDADEIRWYFNGELYATQPESAWFSTADNGGEGAPFNQPFHILLNVAVGGNLPGSPNGTTPWPVTMAVDWVRVYSGEPPPAQAGAVPENAVFVTDPNVTADLAGVLDNFGSGATFNQFYAGDSDFKPTLQVTSGQGYGAGHVGFVAFTGYDAGFAADYQTLSFKVKGLPGDELEIKFFGSPENSIIINLGTYAGATELGNGWYQVTVPMSDFAANVYAFTGFLIGPPGDQGAPFSFLLTDIGFNGNIVTAPADPGTTPDVTLYARGGATDLVPGEVSVFGSGSIPNNNNTGDVDFSPAYSVTTGDGYTLQVGQLAFLGLGAGFAADYLTLDFKVKGMNNDIIRLKLLEEAESEYIDDIELTSSDYATPLGNGWYQVSVPLETFGNVATADSLLFETDNTAASPFTFLLNDIGFSGMVEIADPGVTPEFVLFGTSEPADAAIPAFVPDTSGPQNFGSGAIFDFEYAQDTSFSPVIAVTAGSGYGGPPNWVAFLAVVGYDSPIATGFDTFNVKVKGSPLGTIEVKLINGGADSVFVGVLAEYAGSTDLGDGWYQLEIPFTDFSNPENIPNHTGWLVGPPGVQSDQEFVFLLTDVGFSGTVETADPGITPAFVLFGSSEPADAAIPAFVPDTSGPQNFGSGAIFDFEYAQDTSFSPVIAVTAGSGYGGPPNWVAFLAVVGYDSPIATGFDTFNVKVKGSPLGTIEVKLINGGADSVFVGVLAEYAGSTDLGDGWYQLEIPFTDFSNPENIPNHTGWLVGPPGVQSDQEFVFLLTDVGFSNSVVTADPGVTPEFVLFGTSEPADAAIPAFVPDTSGPQNFGSGAIFDFEYAQDTSFSPVIAVTAGSGYGGPPNWVAFLAVVGYDSPIATGFDTFNVKVKGSPLGTIEVKLINGGADSVFVGVLAEYAGSTDLGDGWYQLEIPFTDFSNPENIPNHTGWLVGPPGVQSDQEFVFLLTDVGFSNSVVTADPGVTPEFVLFGTSEPADAAIPAFVPDTSGPQNFGSGAIFDFEYAQDTSFSPVIAVTAGSGYGGPPNWVAFLAVVGYDSPIATGFDTFNVKVKGSPLGTIEVKLINGGADSVFVGVLAEYAGSTDLGDGWYQLEIPFTDFSNPENIPNHTGWLVGPPGVQSDQEFVFLLTDVGFSNSVVTADPGVTPEFVLFGTSEPADAAIPAFVPDTSGPQNFGSGAIFDFEYAQDTSFSPVIAVTAGSGYGGPPNWVAFLAVVGYDSPIATGFDTFNVKVKGSPLGTIEVKLINGGADSVFVGVLAEYAGSTDLGDGWYQLEIPFTDFSNPENIPNHTGWLVGPPGVQSDQEFVFLLTDVGFSNSVVTADPGVTPEFVLFGTSEPADAAIPAFVPDTSGPQNFGSGAIFDFEYAQDTSFSPVIAVTAGSGYGGPPNWVAFLAVVGYDSPIATGFDTFNVKVKGSPLGTIEVKLINGGADSVFVGVLAEYAGSTDLGDGWYQLEIPFTDFSNPENIPNHTGWLVGPPGVQSDQEFVFLLTDVGFSNAGGSGGSGGVFANGDFETGDFTGWTQEPNGGSITLDTSQPGGRTGTVARLVATGSAAGAQDVLLSQVDLTEINGVTISANDSVTVSADVYGSLLGDGGVVFIELISNNSLGEETGRVFIGPAPIFPSDTWTTYPSTVNVAADVSGGVTLQLKASCGPIDGCSVDAYFDNVSIVIN